MASSKEKDNKLIGDRPPAGWRVPTVVSFAAAVFVATLLAVFSARELGDLAMWWLAAMVAAVVGWLAVAGGSMVWRKGIRRGRGSSKKAPTWARFLGLVIGGCGIIFLIGFLKPLSPLGLLLSLWPIVVGAALLWARDGLIDRPTVIAAGVIVFLICVRLFTIAGGGDRNPPQFASAAADDVRVLSWNIGGGAPLFSPGKEKNIAAIAKTITEHGAHVVCLQEVPSQKYIDSLIGKLGKPWRGKRGEGDQRSSAVLSRISGSFETPKIKSEFGAPIVLTVNSPRGVLQFVSCQAKPGRHSADRRATVDWVLNEVRNPSKKTKTVVAGDFGIDPGTRWSFLSPLLTDHRKFDRATWRVLNVLGSDPGLGGGPTSALGQRPNWLIVDSKMSVTDYRVLDSAKQRGMDHRPVLVAVGLGRAGRLPGEQALGAPRQDLIDEQL